MDLTYGAEYEAFRTEVRSFLDANWPPTGEAADLPRAERESAFRRVAIEAGYLYRNVPKQFGGSEQPADSLRAAVLQYFDEGQPALDGAQAMELARRERLLASL